MERITIAAQDLMRQAHYTAEVYLLHALQWVKDQDLPREDWPAYVGIYVQACSQDFSAAVALAGVQDASRELSSSMMHLVDATMQGLEHLGNAVGDLASEIHEHSKEDA